MPGRFIVESDPATMPETLDCDVLIVGSGPVAATYARFLAESDLRILMVEAGSGVSPWPGGHLRNSFLHQKDRSQYYDGLVARLYPLSVPPPTRPLKLDGEPVPPQEALRNNVNPDQARADNMPAAAACYAVGGMGTVWTCLAPRLHPTLERWDAIPDREWEALYGLAEEALSVRSDLFTGSLRQKVLLEFLTEHYDGASHLPPAPIPVAASRSAGDEGLIHWTGPREILGELGSWSGSERFGLLEQHLVRRLEHRGGKVLWAEVQSLDPWCRFRIHADLFVVAGGALLTPQLLWSSRIQRSETSSLGRFLCDHPLAFAQVAMAGECLERIRRASGLQEAVPVPATDPDPFLTIPLQEDRPFHSLILSDAYNRRALEMSLDDRLLLNLYWYGLTEPRWENRITFHEQLRDLHGMPKPTFHYSLDPRDREIVDRMMEDLQQVGKSMGSFLPMAPPQLLAAGSSMHYMGTTRMGTEDDGRSVVDADCKVWGFDNLYVGGTGVIPSTTATNPTLTACALAVRSALRILGQEIPASEP